MTTWRTWQPGTRVRHRVSGWGGSVVRVVTLGAGNDKVKVRWDRNGHEGWHTPATLEEENR